MLAVFVIDTEAVYPIRIDPTFSRWTVDDCFRRAESLAGSTLENGALKNRMDSLEQLILTLTTESEALPQRGLIN